MMWWLCFALILPNGLTGPVHVSPVAYDTKEACVAAAKADTDYKTAVAWCHLAP